MTPSSPAARVGREATRAADPIGPPPALPGALCREVDGDLWFPAPGSPSRTAVKICRACPEREPCLAYALIYPVMGVWGGTTEMQRRSLTAARGRRMRRSA